jgi:hypothetical protein
VLGGNNPFGVVLATLIGVPMYADIFGTIPIAEALLGKGAQLGTVLSFMMAVTTLSLPSLIMLRKAVKPKLLGCSSPSARWASSLSVIFSMCFSRSWYKALVVNEKVVSMGKVYSAAEVEKLLHKLGY